MIFTVEIAYCFQTMTGYDLSLNKNKADTTKLNNSLALNTHAYFAGGCFLDTARQDASCSVDYLDISSVHALVWR